jgi:RNA polymerase sigma-70 factor (ECF subfamily)
MTVKAEAGVEIRELTTLIQAMAAGEEDALERFYDHTSRQVYGLIMRILKEAALAEEVTLDVFLQVWREAPRYQAQRGNPWAWLVTLARSRAIDRLRAVRNERQRTDGEAPIDEDIEAADLPLEETASDAERSRWVRAALAQLTPEQRQAIVLSYFEGLSHGEIAAHLATPLGTVKTRIRTGMVRLQAFLVPLHE